MAATNRYHLLAFMPAVEPWETTSRVEAQARRLVASGRLRVHTDTARNFARLSTADTDLTFSARELADPILLGVTRAVLARHVPRAEGEAGVDALLSRLREEIRRGGTIEPEKELKVARVLAQSCHPAVMELLLERGTTILVSYAHTVADLMPVHHWETQGGASGLQATETRSTSVYVSCGGDPFFEGEQKTYATDGFPALARMVVIAGQETGHFSDLIHTREGMVLGRYSTDNQTTALRASPQVRAARLADMARTAQMQTGFTRAGLPALLRAEQQVAFYAKRARFSPPWLFAQCRRFVCWAVFAARRAVRLKLRTIPALACGEAHGYFLGDMAFNLAPDADVYRRPDVAEEEAIACIEALARVPQQVNKWGHRAVATAWPQLHRFYYSTVIPGTKAAIAVPPDMDKMHFYQKFNIFLRDRLRPRPGYWPGPADPL